MDWLTGLLTKKATVSTMNPKLKELRQLQGTTETCRPTTLNVCYMLYVGKMLCRTPLFAAGSTTNFRMVIVTLSMQQALCMQQQLCFTAGTRVPCRIGNLMLYFFRQREHYETSV